MSSIRGMSGLPHLAVLGIMQGQGLCLKGIEGSTSLTRLTLNSPCLKLDAGSCWDPLAGLSQLHTLNLNDQLLQDGTTIVDNHSMLVQVLQVSQPQVTPPPPPPHPQVP